MSILLQINLLKLQNVMQERKKMIDTNLVLDKLKNILNIKRDIDLSEKLGKSRGTVAVWRKRGSIDYETVIEFAIKNNISLDYLFRNEINKEERENEDNLLEEFIFFNLKRTLFKKKFFLDPKKINPNIHFLFKAIKERKDYVNFSKKNAKEVLIDIIKNYEIKSISDSNTKKENVVKLIKEEMSNLDCYVFLKYFDKFELI